MFKLIKGKHTLLWELKKKENLLLSEFLLEMT